VYSTPSVCDSRRHSCLTQRSEQRCDEGLCEERARWIEHAPPLRNWRACLHLTPTYGNSSQYFHCQGKVTQSLEFVAPNRVCPCTCTSVGVLCARPIQLCQNGKGLCTEECAIAASIGERDLFLLADATRGAGWTPLSEVTEGCNLRPPGIDWRTRPSSSTIPAFQKRDRFLRGYCLATTAGAYSGAAPSRSSIVFMATSAALPTTTTTAARSFRAWTRLATLTTRVPAMRSPNR
jgi:hypothetical protein